VRNKRRLTLTSALLSSAVCLFISFSPIIVPEAGAAEYRIEPSIMVSEEYNDNVFLTPLNREPDYITRMRPAVHFSSKAPLWDWDVAYAYDYRYLARTNPHHDETYTIGLANLTRIVKDFFFLALRDDYARVSLDVTRDFATQSLFVNQTDQNIATVNPYFVLHSGDRTKVNVGYIYQNIWYKDPNAIKKVDHIGYAEMVHEITSRLSTTIGFRYIQDTNRIQDYRRGDASAGLNYEYMEGSSLYGTIGNSWMEFENAGHATQPFWGTGFNHKFPKFFFSFEAGLRYIEDPQRVLRREDRYTATIKREIERTAYSVSASFREYRNAHTKHLEDSSYSVGGNITHKMTTNSKVSLDLTYQKLEDDVNKTYTELYLSGGRYEYLLLENLTLALEYRYTNSYSPDIFNNDYTNNRIIAEVKKVF
jgi:opacity protein-like surface antigen